MKLKIFPIVFLLFLVVGYALVFPQMQRVRVPVKATQARGMILPPQVVKLLSLEFRTVVANFLFARSSQYIGGKIESRQAATPNDLSWIYRNIFVITELDPYLEDPYHFANAVLTWDVGRYKEANQLLERGSKARVWDWQFPFYIGFNNFYFLHDNRTAAEYLSIAAQRPGAPPFLASLAARLYNNAGKTDTAISFLITFWENERDERIKKQYAVRIKALQQISFLEKAASAYKSRTGRFPKNLQLLVQAGIIKNIPRDPYGGSFYLAKDGSVMTTSNLAFKQKQPDEDQK